MSDSDLLYCPSCGTEYVAGSTICVDCRVALSTNRPPAKRGGDSDEGDGGLVEMGEYPRLSAQILRRRLESAGVSVMVEWSGNGPEATGVVIVPDDQGDRAYAVINELSVDDEMPDTSPDVYVSLIEEHLASIDALLDELRTKIADPDA
jgi:hypothetical protein